MDSVFKAVGKIFEQYLSITFTVGGYKISVASVIMWSILASAVITFLKGLSE